LIKRRRCCDIKKLLIWAWWYGVVRCKEWEVEVGMVMVILIETQTVRRVRVKVGRCKITTNHSPDPASSLSPHIHLCLLRGVHRDNTRKPQALASTSCKTVPEELHSESTNMDYSGIADF
jgi:hypothetical protein